MSQNFNGDKTSVKVNQTPGGNSSISLGWDQKCEAVKHRKVDRNQSSIVFGDTVVEPLTEKGTNFVPPQPTDFPAKVVQPVGGSTSISFGAVQPTKTSVRVRAPPGGKSNIIFG